MLPDDASAALRLQLKRDKLTTNLADLETRVDCYSGAIMEWSGPFAPLYDLT
jgi:hypothetical protein